MKKKIFLALVVLSVIAMGHSASAATAMEDSDLAAIYGGGCGGNAATANFCFKAVTTGGQCGGFLGCGCSDGDTGCGSVPGNVVGDCDGNLVNGTPNACTTHTVTTYTSTCGIFELLCIGSCSISNTSVQSCGSSGTVTGCS